MAFGNLGVKRVNRRGQCTCRPEQIGKDRNLRTQNVRIDRLAHEIDAAGAVSQQDFLLVQSVGGEEENRDVLAAFALLDQAGQFQAVRARHFDVEYDCGKFVLQDGE